MASMSYVRTIHDIHELSLPATCEPFTVGTARVQLERRGGTGEGEGCGGASGERRAPVRVRVGVRVGVGVRVRVRV
eukprot:6100814-Prymnesium_polylepis.1